MFAIIKRELRALIFSWRAYAFVAIFAVCSCALRLMYNFMSLYDSIYGFINHEYILTFLPAALALAVPVLTFSAYENERKNETFSFLRSLPLKATDIIFGKYLAFVALFGAVYAVMTLIDVILGFYTGTDILTAILSVICFLLLANVILAVNMLFSAVFKNRYAALGAGYAVSAVLIALTATRYFMPMLINNVITQASVFGSYTSVLFGLLDISSVVLWLSLGGLFIYLYYLVMKKEIKL